MLGIHVNENDHPDKFIRAFKRLCEKMSRSAEMRKREFREKPTKKRKRKKAAAIKRAQKQRLRDNPSRDRHY